MTERIETVIRLATGPDVLHIGCSGQDAYRPSLESPGWLHGRLAAQFDNLWGLELEPGNVEALRQAGYTNIIEGDAQGFELERQFDTIVAGELIEHLERPGDFLVSVARHLKPRGRVVITTPYAFSPLFVMYAWLKFPRTCSNPEHVAWFCPTTLTTLFQRMGLSVDALIPVEDYRADLPSAPYRLFLRGFRVVRRFLPRRLRANNLVLVATLQRPCAASDSSNDSGSGATP